MIVTRDYAREIAENLRRNNIPVVTTNGCFDIIHSGHVYLLKEASQYGILFVGINSDSSVRRYKPGRPINEQLDRACVISSIKGVSYVVIFDEDNPNNLLEEIKPNFHIKSRSGYKGIEEKVLSKFGGKLVLVDDLNGYSTTNILARGKK